MTDVDLKALLKKKKRAYSSRDKERLKRVQKEQKYTISTYKDSYRRKLELHWNQPQCSRCVQTSSVRWY